MSGSTLSTLRTRVRDLLNEPTAAFWSDAQLNRYIASASNRYHGLLVQRDPNFALIAQDITYTASATSVKVTIGDSMLFKEAVLLEDRTYCTPGVPIPKADSLEDLFLAYRYVGDSTVAGEPAKYFVTVQQTIATGVVTEDLYLWLAPYPSAARTVRLHFRAFPNLISGGDTYTTGLTQQYDDCVVLQATIYAKLQEEKPNLGNLQTELDKAERYAARLTNPMTRNSARVRWESDE